MDLCDTVYKPNSKEDVISNIDRHKIIAILRNIPQKKLINLAEALYKGGIRLLEITFCADDRVSDCDIAKNINILSEHFKDKMYIGAGTVLTDEQVRLARNAGGTFIISPNVDEAVANEANLCGMVYIPGAYTPTEIHKAHKLGADFVKIFPITKLGPGYVKAVKAPLSNIKLLAVGGIDENNITEYLNAGVCGFGIGSNIAPEKLLEEEDYEAISHLAEKYVLSVKEL